MIDPARVSRMRRLLNESSPSTPTTAWTFRPPVSGVIAGPLRRRAMVKQVAIAASRYGLQADVDAYLAAAGCASLAGLDDAQLDRLAGWVGQEMDRMQTVCDSPDAPPAR